MIYSKRTRHACHDLRVGSSLPAVSSAGQYHHGGMAILEKLTA
jgi:hypothetical protein